MTHLAERGVSAGELREMLEGAELRLVMTAHPTEARRRTTVEKLARIFARLRDWMSARRCPTTRPRPAARSPARSRSCGAPTRSAPPPPPCRRGPRRTRLFRSTLTAWCRRSTASSRRRSRSATGRGDRGAAAVTFGSWIGGDRDGNPNVTAGVTASALEMMRVACLHLFEARSGARPARVSVGAARGVGDELAALWRRWASCSRSWPAGGCAQPGGAVTGALSLVARARARDAAETAAATARRRSC